MISTGTGSSEINTLKVSEDRSWNPRYTHTGYLQDRMHTRRIRGLGLCQFLDYLHRLFFFFFEIVASACDQSLANVSWHSDRKSDGRTCSSGLQNCRSVERW
jgi:hypothetical protein